MLNSKVLVFCLCAFLMGGLTLAAQEALLSGPVSGSVYDPASRSLRPIVGLPGASYLGDPLIADLDWAAAAPDGRTMLALRSGRLWAVRQTGSALLWAGIDGGLASPERAAWSADGSAAAIYSSRQGLQLLRSLGDTPAAGPAVELAGRVTALAVEASGACAVAGVEAERDGGIYLVCADAAPKLLVGLAHPAALALAPNNNDALFVADRGSGQILEVRNFRGEAAVMPFAADASGSWDPVGAAVSGDGAFLYVAHRSAKRVDAYEVASRTLASRIAIEWEPTLLEPLAVKSVFLLKSPGGRDEPLLVLEAGRELAVYFVPSGRGQ
jgi:hypothetical protein